MGRLVPALLLLWAALVVSSEAREEPVSLEKEDDQVVMAAARYVARQELAEPQRWVRQAVGRANSVRAQTEKVAQAERVKVDSAPSLAARWSKQQSDLAQEAVKLSDRAGEQKRLKHAASLKAKEFAKQEAAQERKQKTDTAVQQVSSQHEMRDTNQMMRQLIGGKSLRYSKLSQTLRQQDASALQTAKALSNQFMASNQPIREAANEKINKAGALAVKQKRAKQRLVKQAVGTKVAPLSHQQKDQLVLKKALSEMSSVLSPSQKLVKQGLAQQAQISAGDGLKIAQAISHETDAQTKHALDSAQHRDVMKSALLAENAIKPQELAVQRAMAEMVDQAGLIHDAKLRKLRAQRLAQVQAQKAKLLKKQMLMPEALGEMNKVLEASQSQHQEALATAARQIDGEEAATVLKAVQAQSQHESTTAVADRAKLSAKNTLKDALRTERKVEASASGVKASVKAMVANVSSQRKAVEEKRAARIAQAMKAHEKLKAQHQEVAAKAIAQVTKQKKGTGLRHEQALEASGVGKVQDQEAQVVELAKDVNLSGATKTAQQVLQQTSHLRHEVVSHAIHESQGVDQKALKAMARYQTEHATSEANTQELIVKASKLRTLRQKAKVQAQAKKLRQQKDVMPTALNTMSKVNTKTKDLVKAGLHTYVQHPVQMDKAALQAAQQRRAKEKNHKSDQYIIHKALDVQKSVQRSQSMMAAKKKAAEMVQKAPILEAAARKKKSEEKQAKTNEKQTKAAMSVAAAKKRNEKSLKLAAQAEREYQAKDKPLDDLVAQKMKNTPSPLQRALDVQQQYMAGRKQTLQQLSHEVLGHKEAADMATKVSNQFQLSQSIKADPSMERMTGEFLQDSHFKKSREGRYDSLMRAMAQPVQMS